MTKTTLGQRQRRFTRMGARAESAAGAVATKASNPVGFEPSVTANA